MSYLIALAAFAAVITVYSTVVTVLVEGLHKLFALRSAGMNEMLRAFHQRVVAGLLDETARPATDQKQAPPPEAKAFANRITKGLPSESRKGWYVRSWPLIGRFFTPSRSKLSTLQFVEGLAATPEGEALARKYPDRLQDTLTIAAYEYERLGETQTEFFRSRAKALSVIAGIVVAIFINLDAITLYKELASNSQLSSRLTLALDQERMALIQQAADGEDVSPGVGLLSSDFTEALGDFRTLGLPVGRKMFPHCEGYIFDRDGNRVDDDSGESPYVDERCGKTKQSAVNQTWSQSFGDFIGQRQPDFVERVGLWFSYRAERLMIIGKNPQTFLLWGLGVFVGGGLLGLGAPFWYGLFSRIASFAMPSARKTLAAAEQPVQTSETVVPVTVKAVRPSDSSDPAVLQRGFLTVLGRSNPEAYRVMMQSMQVGDLESAPKGRIIVRDNGLSDG